MSKLKSNLVAISENMATNIEETYPFNTLTGESKREFIEATKDLINNSIIEHDKKLLDLLHNDAKRRMERPFLEEGIDPKYSFQMIEFNVQISVSVVRDILTKLEEEL